MKEKKIAIVDYGMGNLRSVEKALEFIGAKAEITENAEVILNSSEIMLRSRGLSRRYGANKKNGF